MELIGADIDSEYFFCTVLECIVGKASCTTADIEYDRTSKINSKCPSDTRKFETCPTDVTLVTRQCNDIISRTDSTGFRDHDSIHLHLTESYPALCLRATPYEPAFNQRFIK